MNIKASEYVNIDNNLINYANFFLKWTNSQKVCKNEIYDKEEENVELSVNSHIKTYSDRLASFREVKTFALNKIVMNYIKILVEIIVSLEKDCA